VNIGGLTGTFEVKTLGSLSGKNMPPSTPGFDTFSVTPVYVTATNKLVNARIVYLINEPWVSFADVTLTLLVFRDSRLMETVDLLIPGQLQPDNKTGSLDYVPSSGWRTGQYTFQAELRAGERLVESSQEEHFTVTGETAAKASGWEIVGIALGGAFIVIAGTIAFVLPRRRITSYTH
jgi:hypothetical protein